MDKQRKNLLDVVHAAASRMEQEARQLLEHNTDMESMREVAELMVNFCGLMDYAEVLREALGDDQMEIEVAVRSTIDKIRQSERGTRLGMAIQVLEGFLPDTPERMLAEVQQVLEEVVLDLKTTAVLRRLESYFIELLINQKQPVEDVEEKKDKPYPDSWTKEQVKGFRRQLNDIHGNGPGGCMNPSYQDGIATVNLLRASGCKNTSELQSKMHLFWQDQ